MIKKLIALLLLAASIIACSEKQNADNGLLPQQTLQSIQLPAGFTVELVASEPMISDPVAMEVDERGDIYVVEMHGYPEDTAGSGKIKLLTDTSGDGMPDKAVVYADHLKLPTGVMKWKKGLLVVDVPDIIYFEDTNNDGKADVRTPMITGLALTNPQHIANTPIYGLDNWIYVAHMGSITPKVSMIFNDTGTNVRFVNNTAARQLPRNADGRNIRFKPESGELEMLSGESQYGQTFDEWGHHFCVENADHIFHEVIAANYLQRNPDLLVADASDYISDHGDACEVYPITTNPENQLLTDRGVITSACGITWYGGGLFPDSFNNVSFVCEPVSNIIHADRITERGATFTASRLYQQKEFFASTDAWCRPVMCYIGPDGALYVIDYYRKIIEHPEWLSEEAINSGELYKGADKGRIYRIVPAGAEKMKWCSQLKINEAASSELAKMLSNNNIWQRRTGQRLLMDRKDTSIAGLLKLGIYLGSDSAPISHISNDPRGIVHALWTLEGYHAIDADILLKTLHHPNAGVRENAILIAEKYLNKYPQLQKELLALQNDSSARVRFQLLCTLGNIHTDASAAAQQKILMHDIEDKWVQVAALSSSVGKELALLEKSVPVLSSKPSEGKALFFANCAAVISLSQRQNDIQKIIQLATANNNESSAWWQAACLKGLAQAVY
ncbi:MAG TPA: dehydrogenase, partial [Chitinophagaceae bacterium]|nr:dehydrogenase [Chitinophagaceae bacterium]